MLLNNQLMSSCLQQINLITGYCIEPLSVICSVFTKNSFPFLLRVCILFVSETICLRYQFKKTKQKPCVFVCVLLIIFQYTSVLE